MWIKDNNGRWIQKESFLNSTEFKRTLQRLKTYSKCLNASTYSVTNNLDNIYSEILYQHGFYVELLDSAPNELIISDILLKKGEIYNLSLTHSKEIIINNKLDYIVNEDDETGVLKMTIRTAIALNYIKAANSLLFFNDCALTYWNDYVYYNKFINENPDENCYILNSTSGVVNNTFDSYNNFLLNNNIEINLDNNVIFKYNNYDYLNVANNEDKIYFVAFDSNTRLPYDATINPILNSNNELIINSLTNDELINTSLLNDWIENVNITDFVIIISTIKNVKAWNILNINSLTKIGIEISKLYENNKEFIIIGQKDKHIGFYNIYFKNLESNLNLTSQNVNILGTNGTSGDDYLNPIYDTTNVFLTENYDESDVYDKWNDNEERMGYSLETYWTPDKTIINLLNNFRLIDIASTENVDIYNEWFDLVIDGVLIKNDMTILLKDQINKSENGIYIFKNNYLNVSDIFNDNIERDYFSVYIKLGETNKYKQFFLDREPNGDYIYGTNGEINFIEAKNYVIRNRVDYKLLNSNTYNDSVIHIDKDPILYDYEKFDLSVNVGQYSYKTSKDLNWIIRKEDNLLIGQLNLSGTSGTSGTSGEFFPLNLCFRLNSLNDYLYYVNYENNYSRIYKLDPLTNESFLYFELENFIIKDFSFEDDILYILLIDNDGNQGFKLYNKDNLQLLFEYDINFDVNEFKVLTVYNVVWYFLLTDETIIQWHPEFGYDIISEEHAKYLIAYLDLRSINVFNILDLNYPVEIQPNNSTNNDKFGYSISISNNKLLVSAVSNTTNGYVYLFDITSTNNNIIELTSKQGDSSNTLFGKSVHLIDNNLAAVSEPEWYNNTGRVNVYDVTNNTFDCIAWIHPTVYNDNNNYGNEIKSYNDELFVTAPGENNDSGCVYVYNVNDLYGSSCTTGSNVTPKQIIRLDGNPINFAFGTSISVNDGYLAIGAPTADDFGKVYLYQKNDNDEWELINVITSSKTTENDLFGANVYITDTFLFVNAYNYYEYGKKRGAVCVFRNKGFNDWEEIQLITLDDTSNDYDDFGGSLYYYNNILYVSAPNGQGAVTIFKEVIYNKWILQDIIKSPNPSLSGSFGYSIAGYDNFIYVGQPDSYYNGYVFGYELNEIDEGTSGTAGITDDYVQISYVRQQDKFPVRLEKPVRNLTDFLNWQQTEKFYIYENFSKSSLGDWEIKNNTLYLKDVDILGVGTNGLDVIPKISDTISRYFDGKDDYIQLPVLPFNDISNISIEFTLKPNAIKTNSRIFYFGSEKIDEYDTTYDSVEFIIKDNLTNRPKFQIKTDNEYLVINSTEPINEDEEVRITITVEYINSVDENYKYYYTGKIWFNDQLVGTSNSQFNKTISELSSLTKNYIAKSDNPHEPLYSGTIKEFRISNIVLNPAQISVRYIPIEITDVTYPNLIYYWDLLDKTSLIYEKITQANGVFIGGLYTDETLQQIENPIQILYNSDKNAIYILTNNGVSTSGDIKTDIFKITFQTEDVDLIVSDFNILSIYVDESNLYWLIENKIFKEGQNLPVLSSPYEIIDFCVVYNKIFYIDNNKLIHDETNRTVFDMSIYPNLNINLIFGYYQTGNINYYNVYIKDINDIIYVLSSSFSSYSSLLKIRGKYPFYYNDENLNIKKGIELNNKKYYITTDNKVYEQSSLYIKNLDEEQRFWSWNVKTIFGISGYNDILYVASIDNSNKVQLWRYNTLTNRIYLVRRDIIDFMFYSTNLDLDLTLIGDEKYYSVLIKENATSVNIINTEKNIESHLLYDTVINLRNVNKLIELQKIDTNSFLFVDIINDKKYVGLCYNNVEYNFWKNVLQTNDTVYKIWIGDFGVALKNIDVSIDGKHSIELLNTYTKFNYYDIELSINKNLNEYNYIVPTWTGTAWINGENGNNIKTEDFGKNWTIVNTNTYNTLNSSNFLNNYGLVVGQNETILETTSYGEFYDKVLIPDGLINNRELTNVLIYDPKYAIVVGKSGLILHFELINNSWVINNNILNKDVVTVTTDDLDYFIKPIIYSSTDETILKTNYTTIKYINGVFWLFGDKGYITKLKLYYTDQYIKSDFEFYIDESYIDNVLSVNYFVDYNDGFDKFLLLSNKSISLFTIHGSIKVKESNYYTVKLEKLNIENNFDYTTSFIENDEYLYLSGYDGNVKYTKLQDVINLDRYNPLNLKNVDDYLYEYFIPRMLITDYYLARKINILLRDKNYVIPKAQIPKNILSCVDNTYPIFNEDEYIEFSAISETGEPNYLAHQDWMYTTRRLMLLEGTNTDGKTKYFPYNKRFVAKDDLTNYVLEKELVIPTDGFRHHDMPETLQNDINTSIRNEIWTDGNVGNFPEQYYHTVLYVNSNFTVDANDVIELKIFRTETGLNGLDYTKILLKESFIIKAVESVDASTNKIVLWALLDPEILTEIEPVSNEYNSWNIRLENLNYFNGHLSDLKNKISKHLVGEVYTIDINEKDYIYVSTNITNNTKYFNLESQITINTILSNNEKFNVKYSDSIIYGPNYNLLTFLNRINPIFNNNYDFGNFEFIGTLFASQTEYELDISRNLLYAGTYYFDNNSNNDLSKFKEGTWVDIEKGNEIIKRVYIDKIEKYYDVNDRYVIKFTFDTNLDDALLTNNSILKIKTRYKLEQISLDLNWTDNINTPTPATDGEYAIGTNGTAGLFEITSQMGSYYNGWHNYVKTATSYAKVLTNDHNVKKYISAIVWIDDNNDLKLNIFNWNNDPNFAFRPIDLHIVGIDASEDELFDYYDDTNNDSVTEFVGSSQKIYGLKRAISIFNTNWNINDNIFGLTNVDTTKYNFILTDGLILQKLNSDYYWILNADIRDAVIGLKNVDNNEYLKWYKGTWLCGIWENGYWYSGTVYNIKWIAGEWFTNSPVNNFNVWSIDTSINDKKMSIWYNGEWGSGIWHNGIWYNGIWYNGIHENGDWYDGKWLNGVWNYGNWTGGEHFNGTWLDGIWNTNNVSSIWYNGIWLGGDFENGIWMNGIWDQAANKLSRFGTKSTLVQKAIWYFGIWKNGEFHNYLNTDENGNAITSKNYNSSIWYNGNWLAGSWYGGTWKHGIWGNGVWYNGLWKSDLQLKYVEQYILYEDHNQEDYIQARLIFKNKHYYNRTSQHLDFNNQDTDNLASLQINKITIFGDPNIDNGIMPEIAPQLGWNSFPIDHPVEIVDDYTLIIKIFKNGYYYNRYINAPLLTDNGTSGTSGTSGYDVCLDENIEIVKSPVKNIYDTFTTYYDGPYTVSHWINGTWHSGIWENGYWSNGRWFGGLWLDGVWERGNFGK